MASSLQSLGSHDASTIPNCEGKRFGIVVSEYHDDITSKLLEGATSILLKYGVNETDIFISYVPGAYEMPLGAQLIYGQHRLDAVLALGCVIKGDTEHDRYINQAVATGLMQLNLATGKPFVFGLLTPNTHQQAIDRSGGIHGNKGEECAVTALKMVRFLLIVFLLSGCGSSKNQPYTEPKEVTISGQVKNYDGEISKLILTLCPIGSKQESIYADIDDLGNFSASFNIYTPIDVWIEYKTNFITIVRPGDKIHLEFDGNIETRTEVLKTVQYSHDFSEENQDVATLQAMYGSSPIRINNQAHQDAMETLNPEEYQIFSKNEKKEREQLIKTFFEETTPSTDIKSWAKTYIYSDLYHNLSYYPYYHSKAIGIAEEDLELPIDYYDVMLEMLPIENKHLISSSALSSFSNTFMYNNIHKKILKYNTTPSKTYESLMINGIIEHTPDDYLTQIILTETINQQLDHLEVGMYENQKELLHATINKPYLINPLVERYEETKRIIENPVAASNQVWKEFENSSIAEIVDSIKNTNKSKITYIDVWGTWCTPCIAEFPNSMELQKTFEGEEVSFVYLCIDSKKESWKAMLSKFDLAGQHYFFDKNQSDELRDFFKIAGIPHYILLDGNGVIIDSSNFLRPDIAKLKIEELLEKKE